MQLEDGAVDQRPAGNKCEGISEDLVVEVYGVTTRKEDHDFASSLVCSAPAEDACQCRQALPSCHLHRKLASAKGQQYLAIPT